MSFNLFSENTLKQTINWLRRNYITIYKERDKKKTATVKIIESTYSEAELTYLAICTRVGFII